MTQHGGPSGPQGPYRPPQQWYPAQSGPMPAYGGPPQGPPPGYWPTPAGGGRRRPNWVTIALAVTVVILLALTVAGIGVLRGWFDEDKQAPTFLTSAAQSPHSFGDDFTNQSITVDAGRLREQSASVEGGSAGGSVTAGTVPALYGGSTSDNACDVPALMTFLTETDTAKGRAFADALHVSFDDLSGYLVNLTPVFLARDTWVTNHGYENGVATPFQSVLATGTAVLVDDRGVPRVRCSCGNPLLEAQTSGYDPGAAASAPWDGFEATRVVRIEGTSEPLPQMQYIDVDTGELKTRGLGSGRTGAIQVTLNWDTRADIDLHAQEPSGTEIYFSNKQSSNGGELDVDACVNGTTGTCREKHNLENIVWSVDQAPRGTYRVWAFSYSMNSAYSTPYTVRVFVDGKMVNETSGTFTSAKNSSTELTFSY